MLPYGEKGFHRLRGKCKRVANGQPNLVSMLISCNNDIDLHVKRSNVRVKRCQRMNQMLKLQKWQWHALASGA